MIVGERSFSSLSFFLSLHWACDGMGWDGMGMGMGMGWVEWSVRGVGASC